MPTYRLEDYLIGLIGMALGCAIAWVLLRRKLYSEWPGFFAYTIYHILQPAADLVGVVREWPLPTYIRFFYVLQVFSLALSFVVIYEVFISVLEPYDALRVVARKVFFSAATVLLLIAVLFILLGPGAGGVRLFKLVYYSERTLRIVQIGLLMLLFSLARSFGLSWRSNAFGIALGYGLYASTQFVLVALRLKYVNFSYDLISTLSSLSFVVMCAVWLCFVLQPERIAQPVRVIPYNDIAKWNEKLEELLKRKAA